MYSLSFVHPVYIILCSIYLTKGIIFVKDRGSLKWVFAFPYCKLIQ